MLALLTIFPSTLNPFQLVTEMTKANFGRGASLSSANNEIGANIVAHKITNRENAFFIMFYQGSGADLSSSTAS
jgi:hypothetical protein